jgi:Protein of unknown function (DUF2950)
MTRTIGTNRSGNDLGPMRRSLSARVFACAWLALLASSATAAGQTPTHRTFDTPEDAVKALVETVKTENLDGLLAIFGPEGRELTASSDPATGRMNRRVFTVAVSEQWHLEDAAPNRKTLVIGNEEWPFPVPLVKGADGWRFDTAAGKEEVLARRIGRNELQAIATSRAYVTAQQRYAQQGHDGKPAGVHATKLKSDPGKENGLYWPTARGQKRSPLGDLVAQAAEEGRPIGGADRPQPTGFHGYYFKILTGQGAAGSGGAKSYIVKGEMTGGFALVAWPAQYDATGVMTFIVNQDGTVRQRDLGPQTDAIARKMTVYNPDASWRQVQ